MITFNDDSFARLLTVHPEPRRKLVYIYRLLDGTTPWYVGSSSNPVARFFEHLQGQLASTAMHICAMRYEGRTLAMQVVDFAECEVDRLNLEAKWIAQTPGTVNKKKMK